MSTTSKILGFISALLLFNSICIGQNDKAFYLSETINPANIHPDDLAAVDSCLKIYHSNVHDTVKCEALYYITEACWDDLVWPIYNDLCYEFTKSKIEENLVNKAELHYYKERYASTINNKGYQLLNEGDYTGALSHFYESLKIFRTLGSQWGIGSTLNNIANVHDKNGDFSSALDYFKQSLAVSVPAKDHGTTLSCLINLGSLYQDEDVSISLDFYKKAIRHLEDNGSQPGDKAQIYNNIANLYHDRLKYDKARHYYNLAYEDVKLSGHIQGIANITINLANLEFEQGNFDKAYEFADVAMESSKTIGFPEELKASHMIKYELAQKEGNYKHALEHYKNYVFYRDSIENERNIREAVDRKYEYEYNLKLAADSLKALEKDKLIKLEQKAKDAEIEQHKLKNEKSKSQQILLVIGLVLAAALGLFIFNRLRISKRQNTIISQQKAEVESQKVRIEEQHQHLSEIHKEVSDSINYAKRLQAAILPSNAELRESMMDSAIIYLPKDVVSGDFYWLKKVENKTLFAVADCTGHGVPGAMVSVVCSNALNRSVEEFKLTRPADILNKTRALVIETFSLDGQEVKDGMDIALIAIENDNLEYAGANNSLWIIDTLADEDILDELKADKQPIGLYTEMKTFTNHQRKLKDSEILILTTDGYIDQFGGSKGKKLKSKNLKQILLNNKQIPLHNMGDLLISNFGEWKGDFEQLDDVCLAVIKPEL